MLPVWYNIHIQGEIMKDLYTKLSEPMPASALSADTSRGFELTSIKAAFIFERLNTVFGLCGWGWRYSHSTIELVNTEVVTEVALQYRVPEGGTGAVEWVENVGWVYNNETTWSHPVYAYGGKTPMGKAVAQTDARKSAVTDGLTKAASMIGVGIEVFKGEKTSQTARKAPAAKTVVAAETEIDSTAFYRYTKENFGASLPSKVTEAVQKAKTGAIPWSQALAIAKAEKNSTE